MAVSEGAHISAPHRGSAREQILECAKRMFAERGFDGVSINDIAVASGASKANIFHHFASKQKLYLAVIACVVKRSSPASPPPIQPDRGVIECFEEMAAAELRQAGEDEEGVRLILQEIISSNPLRSRVLAEEVFAGNFAHLVELIRHQQLAGRFRHDIDPALAAAVLRSVTGFYVLSRSVLRHLPGVTFADEPERYAREAAGLILRGLVAGGGSGEA